MTYRRRRKPAHATRVMPDFTIAMIITREFAVESGAHDVAVADYELAKAKAKAAETSKTQP